MVSKVKEFFRHKNKPLTQWTIVVPTNTINGIPGSSNIEKEEDLLLPIYTINTGKTLPSNIYIG